MAEAYLDPGLEQEPDGEAMPELPLVLQFNDVDNVLDLIEDDQMLATLGHRCIEEYDDDARTMQEWLDKNEKGMALAVQTMESKSFPWPGAANVKLPMITAAAEKFALEAASEIVKGKEVVKAEIFGKQTEDKVARAERQKAHMNYQIFHEMDDWEDDLDVLLNALPVVGCIHRKVYFDPVEGKNVSRLCLDNIVINQYAKSTDKAQRISEEFELTRNDITTRERMGLWREIEYTTESSDDHSDEDGVQEFIEQHRWADLDDDGYEEPYVVTVHVSTRQIVRIAARYKDEDVMFDQEQNVVVIKPYCHYVRYGFSPPLDGTYWWIGWGHKLGPLNEAANTIVNQLLDAGTLSNAGGGFISAALRMKKGDSTFQPGEWKTVQATGGLLKDSVMPLPIREPSNVLFSLLGLMMDEGKALTAISDVMSGEQPKANMAASSISMLIEQGKKVFNGIYKRVWRSLKREFTALARLNRDNTDPEFYNEFHDGQQDEQGNWQFDPKQDYATADYDIAPTANPEFSSKVQRVAQAQALMEVQQAPGVDQVEVSRRYMKALEVDSPELLVPEQEVMTPQQMMEQAELMKQEALNTAEVQIQQAKAQTAQIQLQMAQLEAELKGLTAPLDLERAKANAETADAKTATAEVGVHKAIVELEAAKSQPRQPVADKP